MSAQSAESVAGRVAEFFDSYRRKSYEAGEHLILAGAAPAGVSYITEGIVIMYDLTGQGDKIVLNVFKPGAFIPMSWAMNGGPNEYYYQAQTAVETRLAPAADVVKFVHGNPEVMADLISRLYRGLDGVMKRMALLMGGTARSRVLYELLNAALRFGGADPDAACELPLTERDIAARSGLTRETVNREFQKLKREQVLATGRGRITIGSRRVLEQKLLG